MNFKKRGYRDSIPTLIQNGYDYNMPAIQQARNKLFSQTSNISLSLSQLASSLCPIMNSQNSQQIESQESSQYDQDQNFQRESQQQQSQEQQSQQQQSQQSQQQQSQQQQRKSARQKRNRDSGVISMQPSSSSSANPPPKKKNKKPGRRPFDIYLATKPLSAGECNQSREVAAKRNPIEVF